MMVLSQPPVPALGLDTAVLHPLQCKIILVFLFWVDMCFFSQSLLCLIVVIYRIDKCFCCSVSLTHLFYYALLLLFLYLTSANGMMLFCFLITIFTIDVVFVILSLRKSYKTILPFCCSLLYLVTVTCLTAFWHYLAVCIFRQFYNRFNVTTLSKFMCIFEIIIQFTERLRVSKQWMIQGTWRT